VEVGILSEIELKSLFQICRLKKIHHCELHMVNLPFAVVHQIRQGVHGRFSEV